jgi:hypothetical protein
MFDEEPLHRVEERQTAFLVVERMAAGGERELVIVGTMYADEHLNAQARLR